MRRQACGETEGKSRRLGLACLLFCSSCLVTNDVEFKVVNSPSSVIRTSPEAFDRVPPASDPDCVPVDGHVVMQFEAAIRDNDVDQKLQVRIFVNGEYALATDAPPATMAIPDRVLSNNICIDANMRFNRACSYVEVLVSSEFNDDPGKQSEPLLPGDIGRAEWFVLGDARNFPYAGPVSCMGHVDAGVP